MDHVYRDCLFGGGDQTVVVKNQSTTNNNKRKADNNKDHVAKKIATSISRESVLSSTSKEQKFSPVNKNLKSTTDVAKKITTSINKSSVLSSKSEEHKKRSPIILPSKTPKIPTKQSPHKFSPQKRSPVDAIKKKKSPVKTHTLAKKRSPVQVPSKLPKIKTRSSPHKYSTQKSNDKHTPDKQKRSPNTFNDAKKPIIEHTPSTSKEYEKRSPISLPSKIPRLPTKRSPHKYSTKKSPSKIPRLTTKRSPNTTTSSHKTPILDEDGKEVKILKVKVRGVDQFKCSKCGHLNSRADHCWTHAKSHALVGQYKCQHCDYSSTNTSNVNRHQQQHDESKKKYRYYCSECTFGAHEKWSVASHEKAIHLGIKRKSTAKKPAPGKMFSSEREERRERIEKTRSPVKSTTELLHPFECQICKVKSSNLGHLIRHYRSHKEGNYKCVLCKENSAIFVNPLNLYKHLNKHNQFDYKSIKSVHKDGLRCKICNFEIKIERGEKVIASARERRMRKHLLDCHGIELEKVKEDDLIIDQYLNGKLELKECKKALEEIVNSPQFKQLGDGGDGEKIVYNLLENELIDLDLVKSGGLDDKSKIMLVLSCIFYVGSGELKRVHVHKTSTIPAVKDEFDRIFKENEKVAILIPIKGLKSGQNLVLEHSVISAITFDNQHSNLVNNILPHTPIKFDPYKMQMAGIYLLYLSFESLKKQLDAYGKVLGYSKLTVNATTSANAELVKQILSTSFSFSSKI